MGDENLQRIAARMRKIGEKIDLIQTVEKLRIAARKTVKEAAQQQAAQPGKPRLQLVETPSTPLRNKPVGAGFRSWLADFDPQQIAGLNDDGANIPPAILRQRSERTMGNMQGSARRN